MRRTIGVFLAERVRSVGSLCFVVQCARQTCRSLGMTERELAQFSEAFEHQELAAAGNAST